MLIFNLVLITENNPVQSTWRYVFNPTPVIITATISYDPVKLPQVFASNETLLLQFGLPFTWQRRAGAPETANVWIQVPEWNLLKPQTSFLLCKLANCKACDSSDYANANANASTSQCIPQQPLPTPIKHFTVHPEQVEYDDSLLRQIWVFTE